MSQNRFPWGSGMTNRDGMLMGKGHREKINVRDVSEFPSLAMHCQVGRAIMSKVPPPGHDVASVAKGSLDWFKGSVHVTDA